jgi:hypothetical protein
MITVPTKGGRQMFTNIKLTICMLLLLAGFAGIALLLEIVITSSNAQRYSAIGAIFAAAGALFALLVFGYQSWQMKQTVAIQAEQSKMQLEAFRVEHRPYLFVEDDRKFYLNRNDAEGGWFGGVDLRFRNVGKDPATITEAKYMVASDVRGIINVVKWFDEESGGFPDIKVLFPQQEDFRVPMHPNIAPADKRPRLIYVGAVISYTGPHHDMKYWYKFSRLYVIHITSLRNESGHVTEVGEIQALKPDHDWDNNSNSQAPALAEPKWQDYLSQKYIGRITQ